MSSVPATFSRLQRRYPVAQLAAMVALFFYGSATIDSFSSSTSVRSMLVLAALLGIAAAGQTMVMIIGGFDLSIPGMIVMGAIAVTELCGTHGWGLVPALVAIVVIAGALGSLSGWVCHRYRINPLIVTLGVGSIAVGGVLAWTQGNIKGAPPTSIGELVAANGTTFGMQIPPIVFIWAVFAIAVGLVLHRTAAGRKLYLTGDNPRAAELAHLPTRRIWTGTFALSAVLSALVGVLLAGFAGADQLIGDPYLFQGLTAVIVGGTTIMGARGDYTHTVVGALILTLLTTILVGRGLDTADQQIIFGLLILVVVAGYGRERKLGDRI